MTQKDYTECFIKKGIGQVNLTKFRARLREFLASVNLNFDKVFKKSTDYILAMSSPLISVITAVYNGCEYVEETVKSILQQTICDFEYIIIDDASTDDSVDRIMSFRDPRIKLIKNTTNSKLVSTRNRGLALATGRYIALIDHDDVAIATRFEKQFNFMKSNPEYVLIGSRAQDIDEMGKPLAPRIFRNDTSDRLKVRLLFRNPFVNSTLFFKWNATNPMAYRAEFPLSEDYDFISRLAVLGRIYNMPDILLKYRLHSNNYSTKAHQEILNFGREVKRQQLNKLGLKFTEQELMMHSYLEHQSSQLDCVNFGAVSTWIGKLRIANEKANVYNKESFENVIYDELLIFGEYLAKMTKIDSREYLTAENYSAIKSNPLAALRISAKLTTRKLRRKLFE